MPSRQNSAAAKIVDEAIQLPDRRAAAKLMAERGVNFRTVGRVLDQSARRRSGCGYRLAGVLARPAAENSQ